MNPLKEHAHLFCNGEFAIQDRYEGMRLNVYILEDIQDGLRGDARLIARPIEDMAEDEIRLMVKINSLPEITGKSWGMIRDDLIDEIEDGTLPYGYMLEMLSIGVYPFDQEHFNDGTVLNINEVT